MLLDDDDDVATNNNETPGLRDQMSNARYGQSNEGGRMDMEMDLGSPEGTGNFKGLHFG